MFGSEIFSFFSGKEIFTDKIGGQSYTGRQDDAPHNIDNDDLPRPVLENRPVGKIKGHIGKKPVHGPVAKRIRPGLVRYRRIDREYYKTDYKQKIKDDCHRPIRRGSHQVPYIFFIDAFADYAKPKYVYKKKNRCSDKIEFCTI